MRRRGLLRGLLRGRRVDVHGPCPMPLRPCALRPYSCDCSAPELWLCGNCDCGCKLNIRHLALISTGPMLFTLRLALIRLLFLLLAFLAAKVRGVRALWSVVIQASGMCHVVRGHLVMWQVASGLCMRNTNLSTMWMLFCLSMNRNQRSVPMAKLPLRNKNDPLHVCPETKPIRISEV